jgi:hypothetical protein
MQIINRSRKIQRQILNAQSVKLIEKQLSTVMQHWKQRVGTIQHSSKAEVIV